MISISPKLVLGATPTRINSILYKKRVNGHTPLPVVSILGCYYKTSTWTVCLGVAILIPRLLKVTSRRDYNARTSWFGESSKCILQCLLFLTTAHPHGFSPPNPAIHLGPPPCQAHIPHFTAAFVQYDMKMYICQDGGKGVTSHSQKRRLQKGIASGANPRPTHTLQPKWHSWVAQVLPSSSYDPPSLPSLQPHGPSLQAAHHAPPPIPCYPGAPPPHPPTLGMPANMHLFEFKVGIIQPLEITEDKFWYTLMLWLMYHAR